MIEIKDIEGTTFLNEYYITYVFANKEEEKIQVGFRNGETIDLFYADEPSLFSTELNKLKNFFNKGAGNGK